MTYLQCPSGDYSNDSVNTNDTVNLNMFTDDTVFTNQYYINLLNGNGVLQSDQILASDNRTRGLVESLATVSGIMTLFCIVSLNVSSALTIYECKNFLLRGAFLVHLVCLKEQVLFLRGVSSYSDSSLDINSCYSDLIMDITSSNCKPLFSPASDCLRRRKIGGAFLVNTVCLAENMGSQNASRLRIPTAFRDKLTIPVSSCKLLFRLTLVSRPTACLAIQEPDLFFSEFTASFTQLSRTSVLVAGRDVGEIRTNCHVSSGPQKLIDVSSKASDAHAMSFTIRLLLLLLVAFIW